MPTATEILQRTFLHAPGVGSKTEKSLWNEGITNWDKFLDSTSIAFQSLRSRPRVWKVIEESTKVLEKQDVNFFSEFMPREAWWRLSSTFDSKLVFLDIETTGLSNYYDEITLVGLYDGQRVETLVAGHNLKKLPDLLGRYDIVVTFNGTLVDLPFLKTKLPFLRLPPIHIDLRYLLKRLGYSGGLKAIEQKLGMRRSEKAQSVNGYLATILWSRYKRGDLSALEQLVRYHVADVTNLQNLLRFACHQLMAKLIDGNKTRAKLKIERPKRFAVEVNRVRAAGVRLVVGDHRIPLRDRTVDRPPIAN